MLKINSKAPTFVVPSTTNNKYSLKDKKFYCIDAAVNDFADEPGFYKKYCNKLMK